MNHLDQINLLVPSFLHQNRACEKIHGWQLKRNPAVPVGCQLLNVQLVTVGNTATVCPEQLMLLR